MPETRSHGQRTLISAARHDHGFLTQEDVVTIGTDPNTRLEPILIRMDRCRLTAPAQDALLIAQTLNGQGFGLRDYSMPAGRAEAWAKVD